LIFLDTNVLIDIVSADDGWKDWSIANVVAAGDLDSLAVSDVAYAEFCARHRSRNEVDAFFAETGIGVERAPREALFLAGHAHRRYRASGGMRTGVLADFIIGAHALVVGAPLLTRDVRRYRTYFPKLELIAPGG
jgi:predicted nucleic acid-binding protein